MPNNSVLALAQDKRGFIWMGSSIGLSRYDGVQFKLYKNNSKDTNTISANHIISLYTDYKGVLWVGTSNGLNFYDPQLDRFIRVNKNIVSGTVYAILEDSRGKLWVGTKNGLYLSETGKPMDLKLFSIPSFGKNLRSPNVRAIKEDRKGRIWIGAVNGLTQIKMGKDNNYNTITYQPSPHIQQNITQNYITSIEEDLSQNLWLGTQSSGVFMFNPEKNSYRQFINGSAAISLTHNSIRTIKKVKNGDLWIGTQEGLTIINPQNYSCTNYVHNPQQSSSLSQNSIYSFLLDNNGSMWVGTYFGGVNISNIYNYPFQMIQNSENPNSLSNNVISDIVEDQLKNLWIGTEGGGLNYLNRKTNFIQVFKHSTAKGAIGSNLIKALYIDQADNLWVGTHHGGLNVLPKGSHQFIKYNFSKLPSLGYEAEVSSIVEDQQNRLWVALNYALKVFNKKGVEISEIDEASIPGLQNVIARYLFKDNQGRIWISGINNVYIYNHQKLQLIDSTVSVNVFTQDAKGTIWMGLNDNGLAKYNPSTQKIEKITNHAFINNANIVGIVSINDGSLWLSSNKGLIHYFPAQNHYNVFTKRDGISSNEFNYNAYFKDSDGRLFFGGFNGITSFLPNSIRTNAYVAPIRFTALKLDNQVVKVNDASELLKQDIDITSQLTFNHTQKIFSLDFALLNYVKTEKNRYFYKLEGFDKEWIETTTGSVTYTNLPVGTYQFKVKAQNNDGVWGTPTQMSIKVLPPYWLTWWAYLIYSCIFLVILFFIVRFFFYRELLKKEEALHQAKLNFFTHVSHEIRTHLSLITTPIEKLSTINRQDSFLHQQLNTVKTNAHRLIKLVNELMDFRKMETNHLQLKFEHLNIMDVLNDAVDSFKELSVSKNIQLLLISEGKPLYADFDEEQFEKVIINLISNAFKFTPSGGKIQIKASAKNEQIHVEVSDNGRGIAEEHIENIFSNFFQIADFEKQNTGYGIGLALSKGIILLHGGHITVKSTPAVNDNDGETVFSISIPRKQAVILQSRTEHKLEKIDKSTIFQKQALETIENNTEVSSTSKKYNLLLVEDNEELLNMIASSLLSMYNVMQAKNGLEAWNIAVDEIPDLIISDVMMPEMDGYTLCSNLKADHRTNHIPVILLTANSTEMNQISGLLAGADMYITKPFSMSTLILNIRNLLTTAENLKQKYSIEISKSIGINSIADYQNKEESSTPIIQDEFIEQLISIIKDNIDQPEFGVDILAKKVAMSAPVLYKKLRAITGLTVNEFIKKVKLRTAADLLLEKGMTVQEVAFSVGYNDSKYFSREFKKVYGSNPSEFKG
ncbi:MAG: response regulator [Chitinophagaceae bacterium]|nr:MAG: response regulator [Chitinophagaceae bacterium]